MREVFFLKSREYKNTNSKKQVRKKNLKVRPAVNVVVVFFFNLSSHLSEHLLGP